MAEQKHRKGRHPLAVPIPKGREKDVCPVCRDNFTKTDSGLAIVCPAPGCNFMYHVFAEGSTCWDAVERCARPGCNGKDLDRARIKKKRDLENIRYFAKKVAADEHLSESEMLVFAGLLRDYPGVELSPQVLQKVQNAVQRKPKW